MESKGWNEGEGHCVLSWVLPTAHAHKEWFWLVLTVFVSGCMALYGYLGWTYIDWNRQWPGMPVCR